MSLYARLSEPALNTSSVKDSRFPWRPSQGLSRSHFPDAIFVLVVKQTQVGNTRKEGTLLTAGSLQVPGLSGP